MKFFPGSLLLLLLGSAAICQQSTGSINISGVLKIADSLYLKSEWKAAREYYLSYLNDTSSNSIAWNRLGYANYHLGYFQDAISCYQKALANQTSPQLKPVLEERMAKAYSALGNTEESLNWLEKAQQSGFFNVTDIDTSKVFDKLRSNQQFKNVYQKIYAAAYPCSVEPRARDFDFWIGEWDVYQTGTKFLVGRSIIQNVSGGCAVLENWTSVTGPHNGKSLNFYDTTAKSWTQVWIGSGSDMQTFTNGKYENGIMHFVFEQIQNGEKTVGNFMFYNLAPDKVRQYQETSTDGGKTYQPTYDFTYIRKK